MFRFIVFGFMVVMSASAQAAVNESVTETISLCNDLGKTAKSIMESKRGGRPASAMLKLVAEADLPESNKTIHVNMITAAYGNSSYLSSEEFRDQIFEECFEIRRGQ